MASIVVATAATTGAAVVDASGARCRDDGNDEILGKNR
jgi:hypothetical protein